jgi:hypothetical protein
MHDTLTHCFMRIKCVLTSPSSERYLVSASHGIKGCVFSALIPKLHQDRQIETLRLHRVVAQIVAETMDYYLLMGHILIGHSIRRWATHISNFVEVVHYARLRVGKLPFPRLLSLHQTFLCSASLRLVSRLQEPYQAVIIETRSKRMDLVVLRLRKAMHGYHAPFAVRTHPELWVNIIFREDFTRQRSTLHTEET